MIQMLIHTKAHRHMHFCGYQKHLKDSDYLFKLGVPLIIQVVEFVR